MNLYKSTGLGLGMAAGFQLVSTSFTITTTVIVLFIASVVCNYIGNTKGEK